MSAFESLSEAKRNLLVLDARLGELEAVAANLYEDRLTGVISLETFKSLSEKAEDERSRKAAERNVLASNIEKAERHVFDIGRWVESVRRYVKLENPDRESIHALIERIEIGAAIGRGKNKQQNVTIHYRFAGQTDNSALAV